MEKAKIFTCGTSDEFDDLEARVNEWLGNNPEIEILERKMMLVAGTNTQNNGFVNCTIVLFYHMNRK